MPINVLDASYRSFQKEVVPVCLKKNVGVIGMKGLAGGYPQATLLAEGGLTAEECYRYCLNLPVTTQVVGVTTMAQLKTDIAGTQFQAHDQGRNGCPPRQGQGRLRRQPHGTFKSTKDYDGPHHRKQHGFAVYARRALALPKKNRDRRGGVRRSRLTFGW
ncbi:MAG: hypothetical protein IPJ98_28835 [Bryobacterales bacterium]|nr:hypothetical protein [Bryobacterales bacterium]